MRSSTGDAQGTDVYGCSEERGDRGGYSVRCVELPAAISQVENEEKAMLNVREAVELVLEELEARAGAET
jgi:predicted RNase H-like HicB family nuclease